MARSRFAHCGCCGQAFAPQQPWPRRCRRCRNTTYRNPLPVVILLQPVVGTAADQNPGLLLIRRAGDAAAGGLALPGGYMEQDETWQAAACRELFEETGVVVAPTTVRDFGVTSTDTGLLLVFGLGEPLIESALPPFVANREVSERLVMWQPQPLTFPLHTEVATRYFAGSKR